MRKMIIALAAILGLALSGCGLLGIGTQQPRPGPPSVSAGEVYQYVPIERAFEFSHDAAGLLTLRQTLIFDAGDQTRTDTLRASLGWLTLDIEDDVRHYLEFQFTELAAVDLTDPDQPIELGIERTASPYTDTGELIQLSAPDGWTPGRHVVVLTLQIGDAWRLIDGQPRLVLPDPRLSAPWYPHQDQLEYTSITAAGLSIECMGRHGDQHTCNPDEPGRVDVLGDYPGLTSSGQEPRYYFVRPTDITAAPVAVQEVPV